MKPFQSFLQFSLALCLWGATASVAQAFRVLDIQSANAQGLNGAEFPTITVPKGHTITLTFHPTDHFVQSIWLDDPSWVVVSTDTPLCQQVNGGQTQGGCGYASVMRIRQLSHPISFTPNERTRIVQRNGGIHTILTVLAADSNGEQYVYQFVLELINSSTNTYSVVRIIPTDTRPPGVIISQSQNRLAQIRRGLQRAQQQALIDTSSPEWGKLQAFLEFASSGQITVENAISQSGVSREFVNRLASMGAQ